MMTNTSIAETIRECVDRLPSVDQYRVLEDAKSLQPLQGVPGRSLLKFAGTIDLADLVIMKQAIEKGCEKVDPNEG